MVDDEDRKSLNVINTKENMQPQINISKILCLHLFFLTITVVTTMPVLTHIQEYVPSFQSLQTLLDGDSDVWLFIWNLWWIDHAMTSPDLTILETNYLYYPHSISLVFHSFSLINGLLGYVIDSIVHNRLITYNVLFLLSFYLSGIFTFHCIHFLTGHIKASIVGSLIFMLCPYHFLHSLEHLNLMSIQWLPLTIFYFLRYRREQKNIYLITALSLVVINFFISFYYAIMLLLFFVIFWITEVFTRFFVNPREERTSIKYTCKFIISLIILFSLLILPLTLTVQNKHYQSISLNEMSLYSADLLSFVIPNPLHPVWGNYFKAIIDDLPGNIVEKGVFLGFTPLLLSLLTFFSLRRRELIPWYLSIVIFLVFACGPFLIFYGKEVILFGRRIILPLWGFQHISFLNHFRAPSRFTIMVICFLSILSAHGYIVLENFVSRKLFGKTGFVLPIIAGLIFIEFWSMPLPLLEGCIPSIYQQIAREPGNFSIMEVPIDPTIRKYQFYQTVHHRPILMGYLARKPVMLIKNFRRDSTLRYFSFYTKRKPSPKPEKEAFFNTLNQYSVKYLIVHRQYLPPDRLIDMLSFLSQYRDYAIIENKDMLVFQFNNVVEDQSDGVH